MNCVALSGARSVVICAMSAAASTCTSNASSKFDSSSMFKASSLEESRGLDHDFGSNFRISLNGIISTCPSEYSSR